MALTDAQRQRTRRWWVNKLQDAPCEYTSDELDAVVDAVSQWLADNATSYNDALPANFRTTATVQQKAWVLGLVSVIEYGGE